MAWHGAARRGRARGGPPGGLECCADASSEAFSVWLSVESEDSSFTPCGDYLWLESRAEITNVLYRMESAIAPNRRAAAAERVD